MRTVYQSTKNSSLPSKGLSGYGVSTSTLTPTSTSVFPILSLAEPFVCGISFVSISKKRYSHRRLPSVRKSACYEIRVNDEHREKYDQCVIPKYCISYVYSVKDKCFFGQTQWNIRHGFFKLLNFDSIMIATINCK